MDTASKYPCSRPGGVGLPFSAATLERLAAAVVVVMVRLLNCVELEPVLHATATANTTVVAVT